MTLTVLSIVAAIFVAEGGHKTRYPYGIKSVRTSDPRAVCVNTVRNNWGRWDGRGCFLNFLGDRYCPPKADPVGNRNWKRNVKRILKHDHCDCRKGALPFK